MREKNEIVNEMIDQLPESTKGIYVRAFKGSKASAIKAKCLSCCCNDREEIRECLVYICPLFEVRPYQVKRS